MRSLLAIVVLTVTLNAAIDRTVTLAHLDQDPDREALDDRFQAGGKGLNVARVLRVLGQPARAVVVVGGRAGRWLRDDLARGDIPFEAVEAQGRRGPVSRSWSAATGGSGRSTAPASRPAQTW